MMAPKSSTVWPSCYSSGISTTFPSSGPLLLLFFPPRMLFSWIVTSFPLDSFRSVLKCHLLREAFLVPTVPLFFMSHVLPPGMIISFTCYFFLTHYSENSKRQRLGLSHIFSHSLKMLNQCRMNGPVKDEKTEAQMVNFFPQVTQQVKGKGWI